MPEPGSNNPRTEPNLFQIADVFTRYANFPLGGGSATVAVMHRELLDRRRWVSPENFALCFALARLAPGTNLLAFCTGMGWVLRRMPGALIALFAGSIPSTLIVVVATALFSNWQDSSWAQAAIHGATAAAVGITVKSCWTIARPYFKGGGRLRVILVTTTAFALYVWLGIPPIEVLLLAAVVGALLPLVRE